MTARVYSTDSGEFVVADQAGWVPGSFASIDAAVEGARRANGVGGPTPGALGETKRSVGFEGGLGTSLEVVTYAVDERATYSRDRVTLRASDERNDAAVDLAADEVNELRAVLARWLAARGIAEGPCSAGRVHEWREVSSTVCVEGIRAGVERYEVTRVVSVCGWCGRAAENLVERIV